MGEEGGPPHGHIADFNLSKVMERSVAPTVNVAKTHAGWLQNCLVVPKEPSRLICLLLGW